MRGRIQAGSRSSVNRKSKDRAVPRREIPHLGRADKRGSVVRSMDGKG